MSPNMALCNFFFFSDGDSKICNGNGSLIPDQGNTPIYVRKGVSVVGHNVTTSYYAENKKKNWEMFAVRSNGCLSVYSLLYSYLENR